MLIAAPFAVAIIAHATIRSGDPAQATADRIAAEAEAEKPRARPCRATKKAAKDSASVDQTITETKRKGSPPVTVESGPINLVVEDTTSAPPVGDEATVEEGDEDG